MAIGNPAFCLFLYLTGEHFRGELQHIGDVSEKNIKCWPIRTREIGGARLQNGLYVSHNISFLVRSFRPLKVFRFILNSEKLCKMCDLIKDNVSGPLFKGPNPSRLDPRQRQKNNINFTLLCGASKGFMKALKDL